MSEEFTSIFEIHAIIPEVMFYIPITPFHVTEPEMILFISKAGGGALGRSYTNERWYGEVREYENESGIDYTIRHSGDFYIGHSADHIRAARDYAAIVVGPDGGEGWRHRLDRWASDNFAEYDDEEGEEDDDGRDYDDFVTRNSTI
jgi:hypothetical protein